MTIAQLFIVSSLLAIVQLLIAAIILGITLPRIIKEAIVKNGLVELRHHLLQTGGSVFILIIVSLVLLTARLYIPMDWRPWLIAVLLNVFSLMTVIFAISKKRIYTMNYSKESIIRHARIDRLEKAEVKRENKRR